MSETNVISVLSRQFNHSWSLLKQAIEKISDDYWRKVLSIDKDNYWVFSLTVYHILETSDFYMKSSPEGMEWGSKGNLDWDSSSPLEQKISNLSKSFLLKYLEEIQTKLEKNFTSTPASQLLESDDFTWFPCILDKYFYLLRHNIMHIGELNKALRDWKCPRINWE